jgi:hypothetical protein
MDVATLARAEALNRVAFGVSMILAPELPGRLWIGPHAADDRAKVLARGVGARDLALGAGAVLAVRGADRDWARRAFAAHALADGVDLLAIVAAGRRIPLGARLVGGAVAAGSAAVAAAYAARLGTGPP